MNANFDTNAVRTRQQFIEFLKRLHEEHRSNPTAWENHTLERFLEAMAAWVEDMDGYYRNAGKPAPSMPDWRLVADMFCAARIYE